MTSAFLFSQFLFLKLRQLFFETNYFEPILRYLIEILPNEKFVESPNRFLFMIDASKGRGIFVFKLREPNYKKVKTSFTFLPSFS